MPSSRPLSPHLQIYRPQITSGLSILHRFTGVIATLGFMLIVFWLVLLMTSEQAYSAYAGLLGSGFGRMLLIAWSFSLFYHLCNGVRHLVWDTGRGFDQATYKRSGLLVVAAAVLLTVILWIRILA